MAKGKGFKPAKRTEEDKLFKAPLIVILGGKEYEIKLLVIRKARTWRKKLAKLLSTFPKYADVSTDNPKEFAESMKVLLAEMPDEMADLFFEYAHELNREEIEDTATEVELADAISKLMSVAFPLLQSLTGSLERLAR